MNKQAKKPRRTSIPVQVALISAGGFITAAIIAGLFTLIPGMFTSRSPSPSPTPIPSPNSTSSTVTANAQPPTTTSGLNLDDASQWHIFYSGGSAKANLTNVARPSMDGKALEVSLVSGSPYVGIHAYRELPPTAATTFDLNLSFYFTTTTPIQALEFSMSKWVNGQRWEWALQWENIGDGTPPPWRLWTGNNWQDIGVTQQLDTNKWHTFHLKGDISNGRLRYNSFSSDSTLVSLGQTFPPVSNPGNKLAVAMQLDGDSAEDPYAVYLDGVNFQWG